VEYWGRNEILNTGRIVFSVELLATRNNRNQIRGSDCVGVNKKRVAAGIAHVSDIVSRTRIDSDSFNKVAYVIVEKGRREHRISFWLPLVGRSTPKGWDFKVLKWHAHLPPHISYLV